MTISQVTSDDLRQAVQAAIDSHGYSQQAVATIAGMTQAQLSRWLSGHKDLTLTTVLRLIQVVGLAIEIHDA